MNTNETSERNEGKIFGFVSVPERKERERE
jgi:hypothetical protein